VCNSYFEISGLLECYAACIASELPTFWDNLPVPFSRVKQDNGGKNYHSTVRKVPKKRTSHFIVDFSSKARSFPDGKPAL
jgi:hypothetical protein